MELEKHLGRNTTVMYCVTLNSGTPISVNIGRIGLLDSRHNPIRFNRIFEPSLNLFDRVLTSCEMADFMYRWYSAKFLNVRLYDPSILLVHGLLPGERQSVYVYLTSLLMI